MTFSPAALSSRLGEGLLSFPVTFFDTAGAFEEDGYRAHVARQGKAGVSALFAAGGTGEFFSLTQSEYGRVIRAAADEVPDGLPLLAGVGYGTRMAVEFAQIAEASGADGLLVLPPYLVQAEQDGLRQHLTAICNSVGIGVIAYNRDNAVLTPASLDAVASTCPNLIGLKDGVGNIEWLTALRCRMGDRLIFIGGMPTAEVHATAAAAVGMTTYSSAIYNFAPAAALRFFEALRSGRTDETDDLPPAIFHPLSFDPQSPRRVCGLDRQSRLADRRPGLRAGALASRRPHGSRGRGAVGSHANLCDAGLRGLARIMTPRHGPQAGLAARDAGRPFCDTVRVRPRDARAA